MRTSISLLLFSLSFAQLDAQGADSPTSRHTLTGLHGVQVLVVFDGPAIGTLGVSHDQIQTDVELRLRSAGIPVVASGGPILFVDVTAVQSETTQIIAICINVSAVQIVTLERDPSVRTTAATWSVVDLATTGRVGYGATFGTSSISSPTLFWKPTPSARWVPTCDCRKESLLFAAAPPRSLCAIR